MNRPRAKQRVLAAAAMALAMTAGATAVPTYYGYYEEDDGRFGHFGPETYGFTNYIHLAPLSHDFFKQRLGQAAAAGQRIFLDTGSFFLSRPESSWDEDFPIWGNMVRPYKDHVAAAFVIDEPFTSDGSYPSPNAFTTAQVEHMIDVIHASLPGVKTLINFIPNSTDHWARPSNIDYVGTTVYPWWGANNGGPVQSNGPQTYAQFQNVWNASVGKVRAWAGGKPLWVWGSGAQGVPGVLPNPPYGSLLAYPTAAQAQWYRDILSTPANGDVIGLSWYTYTNEYTVGYGSADPGNQAFQTGSRQAPAALKSFQQSWGRDIGHLPALGPVHVENSKFETVGPYVGTVNTGFGIKADAWFASPAMTGPDAYNISGISLKQMAGAIPSSFTVKLYKVPANNISSNLPTDAALVTTQQFNDIAFHTDDTLTFLPFSSPVRAQAGAKYLISVQSSAGSIWYLWGRRNPGSGMAFSSNQGASWGTTFPDQGFFTPYDDANIEYALAMRDDLNPAIDARQDGEAFARSLERTDWVGQSFTPIQNNISGFAFGGAGGNHLVLNGGKIHARLYLADGGGQPGGSPLISMDVPAEDLGGYPWFDFGRSIPALPGRQYVATLEADGGSISGDWLVFYAATNPLANGQALHRMNGGSWEPISGPEDWKFRSFFTPQFFYWKVDGGGSWSGASNWAGGIPDTVDAVAHFGSAISSARTITVDGPHTAGAIEFDNASACTLAGTATLTLDTTISGTAPAIRVYGGSHTINAPVALAKKATISVAAGQTLSVKHLRGEGASITSGTVRVLSSGIANDAAATTVLRSLEIAAGGRLDLGNNSMVIDYSGAAGSLVDDTRQMLQTGKLLSSAADAARNLGYADNAGLGRTSFGGQTVDSSSLLVKYTYLGDTNLDGRVDVIDLGNLATAWQTSGVWVKGDSNYDNFVDVIDLGLLATNWQAGVGNPLGPGSLEAMLAALGLPAASVPEPSGVGMALAGGLVLRRKRR